VERALHEDLGGGAVDGRPVVEQESCGPGVLEEVRSGERAAASAEGRRLPRHRERQGPAGGPPERARGAESHLAGRDEGEEREHPDDVAARAGGVVVPVAVRGRGDGKEREQDEDEQGRLHSPRAQRAECRDDGKKESQGRVREKAEVRVDGEVEGAPDREALRRLGGPNGEVEDAELPPEEGRRQQTREGCEGRQERRPEASPLPGGERRRRPQECGEQDERRVLERRERRREDGGCVPPPRRKGEGQRDESEGEDLGVGPHQEAEGGREEQ
jgi:hypothetical protein